MQVRRQLAEVKTVAALATKHGHERLLGVASGLVDGAACEASMLDARRRPAARRATMSRHRTATARTGCRRPLRDGKRATATGVLRRAAFRAAVRRRRGGPRRKPRIEPGGGSRDCTITHIHITRRLAPRPRRDERRRYVNSRRCSHAPVRVAGHIAEDPAQHRHSHTAHRHPETHPCARRAATCDDVHRHEQCKPHGEQATQHARWRPDARGRDGHHGCVGREVGIKL
jgi:hypothetical protein